MSNLLPKLTQYAIDTNVNSLSLYGDPVYQLRLHLQYHFRANKITPPTDGVQYINAPGVSGCKMSFWTYNEVVGFNGI